MAAKRRGPRSAAALMAELEADPAWVQARKERDAELRAHREVWRRAEQPVVADLAAVGIVVDSVWDLYRVADSR